MVKNQFCTSVSTPAHLKSTRSVHLPKQLIPSLPSRDLLSQKLNSWKNVSSLAQLINAPRIMERLSKRASIVKNTRSSKKTMEDAVDKVHYLGGDDEEGADG